MYVINDYQLIEVHSNLYLSSYGKGIKIPSPKLAVILNRLKTQKNLEITDAQLRQLAVEQEVDYESLKKVLIGQLNILKAMKARKFPAIYINSDERLVAELLQQTVSLEYPCHVVTEPDYVYPENALVVFYRNSYTHEAFHALYRNLAEEVYVITAGVVHKLLHIDNLYFKGSGLPTHFSNRQQLMTYLNSDIPATKNNWLLFYRELCKQKIDQFPEPQLNACQKGYIAYSLYQFMAQFTHLWGAPTPLDKINWFWHVDLTSFTVHQEVALHSPFSEYDMRINWAAFAETA